MYAVSLKLLLAAVLGWVAPLAAHHRDTDSERCRDSRATVVAGTTERLEPAFLEPRHQGLLP